MKDYNMNERVFKWSQWDKGGMIRCGEAKYKDIMKWMQELGLDAKKCLKGSDKNHAVYGRKIHDDTGRLIEVRLYCNGYVDDIELEAITRGQPLDTFYVAHK